MNEEKLVVKIKPNGSFEIETFGIKGEKCQSALKEFLEASNRARLVEESENTPEYYQEKHLNVLSTVSARRK